MGVFLMCEGSQSTLQRAGVLTIESKKTQFSMCVLFSIKTVRSTEEDLGHFSEFFFPEFFTFCEV